MESRINQNEEKMKMFSRKEKFGFAGMGIGIFLFTIIANLLLLAGAIWVVVEVLQWQGVL